MNTGLADTGQEAMQRLCKRQMGHLGGEAGSAQRLHHLIQYSEACQAGGRQCQALVGGSARHWWAKLRWLLGVSWAPLGAAGLAQECKPRPVWETWSQGFLRVAQQGLLQAGGHM